MPNLSKKKIYGGSFIVLFGGAVAAVYLLAGASTPPQAVPPAANGAAQTVQLLDRIEPGTTITAEGIEGWSDLVLLVIPQLTDGDVDALHPYALDWASMFMLTIAADVRAGDSGKYELNRLGVGFAYRQGKQLQIISSNKLCGVELGPIDRQVLAGNEECLDDVHLIAQTPTMTVFDAANTQIVIDGRHQQRITRHAVLVDEKTGRVTSLAWLLRATPEGTYVLDRRDLRWMPPNLREQRRIHVDKAHVTLGIPTPEAFAMMDLPPGKPLLIGEDWEELAIPRTMATSQAQELEAKLSQAVAEAASRE